MTDIKTPLAGTAAEYLVYLSSVRRMSERTVSAYGVDLSHFTNYCGNHDINVEAANAYEVERFITDLSAEGTASVSVNRALSAVRGYYRYLVRNNLRQDNPCGSLKNLKTPKTLPGFLKEKEMATFAGLPDTAGILWPTRDKALILVMYSAGLRISELVSLSVKSLNPDLDGARVIGKGDKERYVFFSDEARDALIDYLAGRKARIKAAGENGEGPTDKLFVNRNGGGISVPGVRWIITKYAERSGLGKNIHPHSLRH
ncbi:MAG: tyrosine-type recombinase/integrase, partial [Treponema sp.]|nr:tyrosine-type recombinase/integrase [Treponema sp.]